MTPEGAFLAGFASGAVFMGLWMGWLVRRWAPPPIKQPEEDSRAKPSTPPGLP